MGNSRFVLLVFAISASYICPVISGIPAPTLPHTIAAPLVTKADVMQPDATAPPTALLSLLGILMIAGLVCLAIIQRRAIRRARSARRKVESRTERLEEELAEYRRAAEESLQQEERYRTPLEQTHDYTIFLLDRTGRPTSWNSSVRRVLGYERSEFLRLSVSALYPGEDREAGVPERDLAEAAELGRAAADRWVLRKDGSRIWASMSVSSVHDRHKRVLGFSLRLRDLTRSKHIEHQLHRHREALELALEAAGLGTWEHDLTTGELRCDARANALFGLPHDASPTHAAWLETVHPDDQESAREQWQRAVHDRSRLSAEFRVIWPDGSNHWIMAVGQCTCEPGTGEPLHLAGIVLDLTERRHAEAQFQETLRLEAVGRLAGGIAHDLNNMLAAILGFSEFLDRSLEPDDPRRADAKQISRAAERSAGLTRQLLAFARRELIQPQNLDINAVVRHTRAMLASILSENVELVLQLAPDPTVVLADARQIEQTLMNLVLNARDAMPRGGRLTVETKTVRLDAPAGNFAMLAVTDTGHGMDAATLQRMWEPFFTTKPPGQGTGLGLSSVYGAVRQSGGFVWADSEPGRGTTVQVYWPEVGLEPEPVVETGNVPTVRGGSETVLVVEDEELVRAPVVRALRGHGYRCLEARDGIEALRLLEQDRLHVDLVVTDVVMPGMSGGGLGDRLALLRPDLPVLYTSAYVDEDIIGRGLLEEGRPFLQKPCTPRDLARKVREVLDAAGSAHPAGGDAPGG